MDKETIVQLLSDGVISNEVAAKYFPELKENEDEKVKKELIKAINLAYDCGIAITKENRDKYLAWIERQGEQKFKVGDWVVTNQGKVNQVVSVDKDLDGYTLDDGNYFSGSWCDMYHLWTIEDAKDGDIIYSKHNTESFEWIGILKSLDKENKRVFFYGFWHDMAKTFSVCMNEAYVLYDDFTPATKEQRDLLFQKMKEAGYEWDEIKKKLKTIEDEPNVCEGCNNAKGCVTCVDGSEWAHIEEAKSFWSEVDETAIHLACEFIRHHSRKGDSIKGVDCTEFVKMLWSIKERMQAQHQQEWSEDDEIRHKTTLEDLEAFLECIKQKPSREISAYHLMSKDSLLAAIQKDIDWFRTLKDRMQPQSTWKPSDEQMEALAWALGLAKNCGEECAFDLRTLQDQLKKLKE